MHHTGIVIVSYNASEAVRVTLASVARARNEASFDVVVVDNASDDLERDAIRSAVEYHATASAGAWSYVQLERNVGFSAGNNVGIRACLEDPRVSHVCLLNSDVIVSDHWLDRLLAHGVPVVSSVTNKADGEQCVPVDYEAELSQCLSPGTETIAEDVYARVQDFADRWHAAWRGHRVECDVTFFLALLTRGAFDRIGMLDEQFFPGGFEDDDYCLRAQAAGLAIHLARDTFVHHWGSASFGRLQYAYFNENARRNREYLERKHGITWRRRPEKPFVSFERDVAFALGPRADMPAQAPFLRLYTKSLLPLLDHFESEFAALSQALRISGRLPSEGLAARVAAAEQHGRLRESWEAAVSVVAAALTGATARGQADVAAEALARVAAGVHDRVNANIEIHALLTAPAESEAAPVTHVPEPTVSVPGVPLRPQSRPGRAVWIVRRGLRFLAAFDGVVFFGGYFYPERQGDGYFQRIQIVDRLFADKWRVYVESDELRGRDTWFDRPEPQVLVLRILGTRRRRWVVRLLALLAVARSRRLYFHSVLRMYDNRFGRLLHLPFVKAVVDIHGVVPEEFRMHSDFYSALIYEREEALAVRRAGLVVVVTDAMRRYLQQKFRQALRARVVEFPMFPPVAPSLAARPYVDGKPVVVYAGGLHKWQQVPKMVEAMARTIDAAHHRFYCPDPAAAAAALPGAIRHRVLVEARPHDQLMDAYRECHYGFILREDTIVNTVACPTKLVEYLALGIVPIVDTEHIGDFRELGMHAVTLPEFLRGDLPSEHERAAMAEANHAVYLRLKEVRQAGARAIREYLAPSPRGPMHWRERVRRALPPETRLGRFARRTWRAMRPLPSTAVPVVTGTVGPAVSGPAPAAGGCDVLMQVENFEAGGLENAVINVTVMLASLGYRTRLLVLGTAGAAVQRARDLGLDVIIRPSQDHSYEAILDEIAPRMVMAHYSIHGAAACVSRGIPFTQVLHNAYMWFDDAQRAAFAAVAARTTAFVAPSAYPLEYSVARLGVDRARCTIIPHGIDYVPFETMDGPSVRRRLRQKHGVADDQFVFLDVGAINHQKNHLGTLRAFAAALRRAPTLRLLVLGPAYEPSLLEELLRYIRDEGLDGSVQYAGATEGAHEYFAMADAFVSGTFFEAGPLTLLEALRMNLPVVMPNVGLAQAFAGRRGFDIVEPAVDLADYRGAIWQLVSTPEFEARLAVAMVRTARLGQRPDLPVAELVSFERSQAYRRYAGFVDSVLAGRAIESPSATEPALAG